MSPIIIIAQFLFLCNYLCVDVVISCELDWHECNNGDCIPTNFLCDGDLDCPKGDDEKDCANYSRKPIFCAAGHYSCENSSLCLPHRWHCDGSQDCPNGDDEENCNHNGSLCKSFLCKNFRCILKELHCDHYNDCMDNSDEEHCIYDTPCVSSKGYFKCKTGVCINHLAVCNNHRDCPNGEDEGENCNHNGCSKANCSQECFQTPKGPQCYCWNGYELNSDNKTCIDIDECLTGHNCSQNCKNTIGGYVCSCLEGYELQNNISCVAKGPEPLLLFTVSNFVNGYYLKSKRRFKIRHTQCRTTGFDFDIQDEKVYWAEVCKGYGNIYSSYLDGKGYSIVIENGLNIPEDIKFDLISKNLYITDSGLNQIIVCKIKRGLCSTLIKDGIDKIKSIELDPKNATMYWSESGLKPGIYQAFMDGAEKKALIDTDIAFPASITLDDTSGRLYWIDSKLNRIEYYEFNLKKRNFLYQNNFIHPISLTIFEDFIYWSDQEEYSINRCKKFNNHNMSTFLKYPESPILNIRTYHPILDKFHNNPCFSSHCSDICLLRPNDKYSCACPNHLYLDSNKTKCLPKTNDPFILVSVKDTINQIYFETIGKDVVKEKQNTNYVFGPFSYHWDLKVLFAVDLLKAQIVEINIENGSSKTLFTTNNTLIHGLTYDGYTDNLYWLDTNQGYLEVGSRNGKSRVIILKDLERPIDMAFYQEKNKIYIALLGSDPHIIVCNLDGKNVKNLIETNIGLPVSVYIDKKKNRLYWADARKETINAMKLSEQGDPNGQRTVIREKLNHVMSLIVHENMVYWTTMTSSYLYYAQVDNLSAPVSAIHLTYENSKYSKYLHYAFKEKLSSPCSYNKGNCSNICLMSGSKVTCVCPFGFKLSPDEKTCHEETIECKENELKCNDNSGCYIKEWQCNGRNDCDDRSDEKNCLEICNKESDFKCKANNHCISSASVCDGVDDCQDGFDEQNCTEIKGCKQGQFECGDKMCISQAYRCDNVFDCLNKKDEEDCKKNECTPSSTQMRCNSGECININWKCDGEEDCKDNSDEENCQIYECKEDQFKCKNGFCINKAMYCDRFKDCNDGSDEENCHFEKVTCPSNLWVCESDKHCIYPDEICDSYSDCLQSEDEKNCTYSKCPPYHVLCDPYNASARCIPDYWLCDGQNDCGDWSDEYNLQCKSITSHKTTTSKPCKDGSFPCNSGECIDFKLVCDKVENCIDGSDENENCASSCVDQQESCSQICRPLPTGSSCSCYNGYILGNDKKTCHDIDECGILGQCSQYCHNFQGGFNCSCAPGYKLTNDKRKCKAIGGEAFLIYMLPNEIRSLGLFNHSEHIILSINTLSIKGIDFCYKTGRIFWTDDEQKTISSIKFTGHDKREIVTGLKKPSHLSYDYITKNFYFVDNDVEIHVCNEKGNLCTIILQTGLTNINSFIVCPSKRLMFWSVWSSLFSTSNGRIERADMNGKQRKNIIKFNLNSPSGLTVDPILENIYWVDTKQEELYVADFNGNNRHRILDYSLTHPLSIVVFEDNIYWANIGTDTLMKCNKFSGTTRLIVHKGNIKAHAMKIFHEVIQPKEKNPCQDSHCDQLCLLSTIGFSCECNSNYKLADDNFTCLLNVSLEKEKNNSNLCKKNSCKNGGVCRIEYNTGLCDCPKKFSGPHCEFSDDKINLIISENKIGGVWLILLLIIFAIFSMAFIMLISLYKTAEPGKSFIFRKGFKKKKISVSFKNPVFNGNLKKQQPDDYNTENCTVNEVDKNDNEANFGNPMFGEYVNETGVFIQV